MRYPVNSRVLCVAWSVLLSCQNISMVECFQTVSRDSQRSFVGGGRMISLDKTMAMW